MKQNNRDLNSAVDNCIDAVSMAKCNYLVIIRHYTLSKDAFLCIRYYFIFNLIFIVSINFPNYPTYLLL